MANDKRTEWGNDFQDFLEAAPAAIPAALSKQVTSAIQAKLHPSFGRVLLKLLAVQAVAGTVSLLYCPQFGLSFTGSHGLMHYLMQYGETVCMISCGALFSGASLLAASLILKPEEVRAVREHRFLQVTSLAALSLGVFACLGGVVAGSLALTWVAGAVIGGLATLELGWCVRRFSYKRSAL